MLMKKQNHYGPEQKETQQKQPTYYVREQDECLESFSLYFCTNRCIFFTYLKGWDNRNATHIHQVDVCDYQHDQDDNIYQSDGEETSEKSCL